MGKKILIVDDEENVSLVLKELFILKGYEVFISLTGREAIDCLDKEKLDLILLDMQMPDINGIEILRQIRKDHAGLKTVVLTGFLEEYKKEIEEIGCDALLYKPFSINALLNIAELVLSDQKAGRVDLGKLAENRNILAKAKLLFIEPNQIMYSSKLRYFKDRQRCRGDYELTVAFSKEQIFNNLKDFLPDIVLSDVSMFRLYKLADTLMGASSRIKDVILYGINPGSKKIEKTQGFSFVGGLFDPITAAMKPEEMDKLGDIVRTTAIAHNLYIRDESI